MGYVNVHDISTFISPFLIGKTQGTWSAALSSNVVQQNRAGSSSAFSILIPLQLPGSEIAFQGAKIVSVEVYYKIATAAATAFSAPEISKVTLPATGVAPAGAALACTMDVDHDTEAERYAIDDHTMLIILDTPAFLNSGYAYYATFTVTPAAGSIFSLFGAKVNYTLRL